jgi:hypothetical protein
LLFRHDVDSAAALRGSQVPIALIAAERDTLVRPERTAALRKAVGNLRADTTIPGATHNDIFARPQLNEALRSSLEKLAH